MAKVRKVLSVTRKPEGSDWMMKIRWELRDGIWEAQRQMPGVNEWADLPDLNSVNMVDVFKAMRDILAGTIDKELLSPIGD